MTNRKRKKIQNQPKNWFEIKYSFSQKWKKILKNYFTVSCLFQKFKDLTYNSLIFWLYNYSSRRVKYRFFWIFQFDFNKILVTFVSTFFTEIFLWYYKNISRLYLENISPLYNELYKNWKVKGPICKFPASLIFPLKFSWNFKRQETKSRICPDSLGVCTSKERRCWNSTY